PAPGRSPLLRTAAALESRARWPHPLPRVHRSGCARLLERPVASPHRAAARPKPAPEWATACARASSKCESIHHLRDETPGVAARPAWRPPPAESTQATPSAPVVRTRAALLLRSKCAS